MSQPDPVIILAAAVEKCLADLSRAVGEFKANYRPPVFPTTVVVREPVPPAEPVQAPPKEWMTTEEAAEYMRYEPETLSKWARTGCKGPRAYGKGKDRRYKKSECDEWLQRFRRETADTLEMTNKRKRQ